MGFNTIILSVGCNVCHDTQMERAKECLTKAFPGIRLTAPILSPAYGMGEDAVPYANCLAVGETELSENALRLLLKELEVSLGDERAKRTEGIVMMDIDLLKYNEEKRNENDWDRPYIQTLFSMLKMLIMLFVIVVGSLQGSAVTYAEHAMNHTELDMTRSESAMIDSKPEDASSLLSRALEYFQGMKYHEAAVTFERLQRSHNLNPRFKAYLGFSYYKEGEYEKAIENLVVGIPNLSAYSPREQSVYIFSCAESYFNLQRYEKAIEYYDKALPLVSGFDKGDILYHKALAFYQIKNYTEAYGTLREALGQLKSSLPENGYDESHDLHMARIKQTEVMLRGLSKLVGEGSNVIID